MRILVTGCAGYIGSMLCRRLLKAGHTVVGIDNFKYNNQQAILPLIGPNFIPINDNVRNIKFYYMNEVDKADVIFPLAAIVGAPLCQKYPMDTLDINYYAIADMLPHLSRNQRVIYPNTNSGYGTSGEEICTEESPLKPISIYGKTKCWTENAILQRENSVSLRLATVCGASHRMRFDLLVNSFTAKVFWGQTINLYEPHYRRNFVHIKDVVEAFKFMLDRPNLSGAYNCGNPDSNLTKKELVTKISEILDVAVRMVIIEGKDPDQRNYFVSNDKIKNAGFVFNRTLSDAVKEVGDIIKLYNPEDIKRMGNY